MRLIGSAAVDNYVLGRFILLTDYVGTHIALLDSNRMHLLQCSTCTGQLIFPAEETLGICRAIASNMAALASNVINYLL